MIEVTWAIGRRVGRIGLLPLLALALLSFLVLIALPQVPDPLIPRAEVPVQVPLSAAASGVDAEPRRVVHQT